MFCQGDAPEEPVAGREQNDLYPPKPMEQFHLLQNIEEATDSGERELAKELHILVAKPSAISLGS